MGGFWAGVLVGVVGTLLLVGGGLWLMGRVSVWFLEQDRHEEQANKREQFK